ncbi:Hypothetical_protein [Hexamita inflata]|uniref:Hypothetical_protein n=1 Tax=Hexamita inflata TaxID=28002 RepID=A0AA86U0B4_9EUKA|nr:Hypothetical protein HINF_LOCUS22921 [Hexamita inflata]
MYSIINALRLLISQQVTRTNDSKSFSGGICAYLYSESVLSVDYLKVNGSAIKSIHTGAFICGSVVVKSVLKVNGVNISSSKVNVEYQAFAGVVTAVLQSTSMMQIRDLLVSDVQVNSKVDSYSAVICAHANKFSCTRQQIQIMRKQITCSQRPNLTQGSLQLICFQTALSSYLFLSCPIPLFSGSGPLEWLVFWTTAVLNFVLLHWLSCKRSADKRLQQQSGTLKTDPF